MAQRTEAIKNEIEQTRERIGETVDAIGDKANVPARTKRKLSQVKDRATQTATDAKDRVVDALPEGGDVRERARRAADVVERNPLGLALAGFATGIAVGSLLPVTRKEDETIGPVAQDMKETAKRTGREAIERGEQVARETAETAKGTLLSVGEEATEKAQRAAAEVAESTQQRVRKQTSGARTKSPASRSSSRSSKTSATRSGQRASQRKS